MQAYFDERAHFDQASAILDSNSEEAWGETKMRPREWELEWRRIYDRELQNACTAGYIWGGVISSTPAPTRQASWLDKRLHPLLLIFIVFFLSRHLVG